MDLLYLLKKIVLKAKMMRIIMEEMILQGIPVLQILVLQRVAVHLQNQQIAQAEKGVVVYYNNY